MSEANKNSNTWAILRLGVRQQVMMSLHEASRRSLDAYRVAAGVTSILCDHALSTDQIVDLMNRSIKRAPELGVSASDQMVKMFDLNFAS